MVDSTTGGLFKIAEFSSNRYSTVKASVNHGVGFFGNFGTPSTKVQLYDFSITGITNVRDDDAPDSGLGGALTNTLAQNLWIEHTKCGMWLGKYTVFHLLFNF
jgi:hypothetical protein